MSSGHGSKSSDSRNPANSAAAADDDDDRERKQAEWKGQCEQFVRRGFSRNVTVKFLLQNLEALGCKPPKGFVRCVDCGEKMAGGGFGMVEERTILPTGTTRATSSPSPSSDEDYHEAAQRRVSIPQCRRSVQDLKDQLEAENDGKAQLKLLPEIFLCQQHIRDENHAHLSMVHELIHAIDMCRTKMDPLHNCIHMACTEIRAENLSGECSLMREVLAGRVEGISKHGQTCVKRRAALSLKANPNCSERAHEYVDAAFERCFEDTYPFDRHPNLR